MGRPRQSKHGLIIKAHTVIACLDKKLPAHSRLRWTRTRRGEKYDGHRVAANSPLLPAIPLPLLHALPTEQALAYNTPEIRVQASSNYNAAKPAISNGFLYT